ncbi:MAG: UvrABC system protein C, partial [Microgenomates group bacterium GW2011_GWA2_47_8]
MEHISKTFLTLPRSPGVYLFKDSAGVILYVGKAKNLANRVRQYFTSDGAIGGKTRRLVPQIRAIEVVQTDTEFDALIQEAKLIHAYQPKYNAIAKDDKSPLYMVVTRGERLPRIFF